MAGGVTGDMDELLVVFEISQGMHFPGSGKKKLLLMPVCHAGSTSNIIFGLTARTIQPSSAPVNRHIRTMRNPRSTASARLLAAAILLSCAGALFAQPPLRNTDITVAIACVPEGVPLRVAVSLADTKPAGQLLQVSVTNTSGHDIALTRLTARIPCPRPAGQDVLIATGAWDMGRTQTRVWPASTTEKLESGTFVASRAEGGATMLAGFVTWKTFHTKLHWETDAIIATADGEDRTLKPGETVEMEKIWIASAGENPNPNSNSNLNSHPGLPPLAVAWQDLFFAYADRIAAENRIRLNRPPKPWVGWATWDYYGFGWNHDTVKANMDALLEICPQQASLIQIDAGWGNSGGDRMKAHTKLGADGLGMKRIAALARSKNLSAGTYFVPMRDGPKSAPAREHPEYFLHDAEGSILTGITGFGSKAHDTVFFDYSNPAAVDYIKRLVKNAGRDWGFDYFKADFLRDGIGESIRKAAGPDARIVPHDRSLTSVERFHRGLAAMREAMGPDAYFVSCSAFYGPSFGHVDALRAGDDISPKWWAYKKCSTDAAGNFHLHGKVVHIDTDYIVVRSAQDQDATRTDSKNKDGGSIKFHEARMWAHFAALCGSARISGDNLTILRPERRALFAFAAAFPAPGRFIPLDFWAHARSKDDPHSVILSVAGGDCYLGVFNWTDDNKHIVLTGIPAAQLAALDTVSGDPAIVHTGGALALTLKPRHSAILKIPGDDFDALRHTIEIK